MDGVDIFDSNIMDSLQVNEKSGKVFVYIVNIDKYSRYISQLWACLSAKEKEQASRYHTGLLTKRYIISHGILRCILSYYAKQLPQCLKFTYNKHGKPFLEKSHIQFNTSHSHNMACYTVSFNYMVGIDIECQDHTLDVIELLDLVFTKKEIALFNTFEQRDQHKIFYNLWTKKESLVKAIGLGLSYPINTIEVLSLILDNKVILNSYDNIPKQALYNYTLNVGPNYFGAISVNAKINEIVYLEASNQEGVFDKIRIENFN